MEQSSDTTADILILVKDFLWIFFLGGFLLIVLYRDRIEILLKQWRLKKWFDNKTSDKGSVVSNAPFEELDLPPTNKEDHEGH